ncbi:NRDE family protein [Pseudomonas berkeleyensis]|uniref:NRDE family protein n=1 Tax=Pseudomonas berkeleyensis TaxID=2726956 RepID=A0A7G5DMM7_9PSED|nr:NRDE family protein [Pseudomonas berkeleyensis]QMV63002.1 NRDE family protein [Pseudomonas berkeleyensis]WSO38457.1 NRDE family protein [Pseudomonas berkeleyensis]
MCLIVFAWRPENPLALRLAANRDEFYARPSAALGEWREAPGLFAGRDLEAGGTWLGITASGRFAALTNIRDPRQPNRTRSRGELSADFLRSDMSPQAYLQQVMRSAEQYAGFNLLLGDTTQLWHFNSHEGEARRLESGVYGLSNASLDTPWPKLVQARRALQTSTEADDETLMAIMADNRQAADHLLPDTGVGLATERLLSSIFITSAAYGTRASTALALRQDGSWRISERSFGPHGALLGEVSLER